MARLLTTCPHCGMQYKADDSHITLGYAGSSWIRPEGVKSELEKMAAEWKDPPSLPSE